MNKRNIIWDEELNYNLALRGERVRGQSHLGCSGGNVEVVCTVSRTH